MFLLLQSVDDGIDAGWVRDAFFEALVDGLMYAWPVLAIMGGIIALIAGFRLLLWYWRRHMLVRSGIREIDVMGGEVFERYLEVLFSRLGYRVERTRFVGDYGGDLVLRKDGVRTVVQAKRHAKNVGVKAVQEAVAAKGYYGCDEAMVVCNRSYTRQAEELALRNDVVLWDRDELVERLSKIGGRGIVQETTVAATPVGALVRVAPVEEKAAAQTALSDVVACGACSKILTPGERRWCEANARRVRGRMLCFRHQRVGAK